MPYGNKKHGGIYEKINQAFNLHSSFSDYFNRGVCDMRKCRGRNSYLDRRRPVSYTHLDVYKRQDICFVTTAQTDEEARELLKLMGAPFAKE